MKRVYKPTLTPGQEWALPVDGDDNLKIVDAFGKPLAATWTPVRMKIIRQDEGRLLREVDMPWMGSHLLILRPRASAALRDLCERAGELVPLACGDAELVAWNVTTVVDALDLERTKAKRFSSGGMWIEQHVFKPEAVEGLIAFRIPQLRASIYVGPELVQRVKEAGLTGTRFDEVWPIN